MSSQDRSEGSAGGTRAGLALLSRARELQQSSRTMDYRMPVILPFVPVILEFIGAILAIAFIFIGAISVIASTGQGLAGPMVASGAAFGIAIYVLALVIYIYVVYKWISRRNSHFERVSLLAGVLTDLSSTLKLQGAEMIRMRYDELQQARAKRSVGLNVAAFIIIPFYALYVFHFLNKDFARHSEKEALFLGQLISSLRSADPHFARRIEEFERVDDRSTLLYVILYLITLGLFGIYWVYVLTRDPNAHFESHEVLERDVIASFERLLGAA